MDRNPVVSVIIPTYNRAHLISRAVRSVLRQTYGEFELIVVDDGSSDNTEEVVRSFNDTRIKYIRHDKNRGVSAARNTGIKAARGEYISFLDSDDEWLPDKLRRQLAAFQKAPQNVGAIYTQIVVIDNGKPKYMHRQVPPQGNIHRDALNCLYVGMSTLMVKSNYLEQAGGFDENFFVTEDWDFSIRLSSVCNFIFIKTPLVIRHVMPDSLSVDNPAYCTAHEMLLNKHIVEIQRDKRMLAAHCVEIGRLWCLNDNLAYGRRYYARAWKANPLDVRPLLGFIATLPGQAFYKLVYKVYVKLASLVRRLRHAQPGI